MHRTRYLASGVSASVEISSSNCCAGQKRAHAYVPEEKQETYPINPCNLCAALDICDYGFVAVCGDEDAAGAVECNATDAAGVERLDYTRGLEGGLEGLRGRHYGTCMEPRVGIVVLQLKMSRFFRNHLQKDFGDS
jgi:hypothetical protein